MGVAWNPLLNAEGQYPPVMSWVVLVIVLVIVALWCQERRRRNRKR